MRHYHYEPCPKCRERGQDSAGDNLVVYQDGAHCFSCGYHRFPKYYHPKPKELPNGPKSTLPSDFTREIPTRALKWLLQYGLPYSYWKESIGYSKEKGERLVITCGTPLAFSIGRLVSDEEHRKWYVWGDSHKHCEVVGEGLGNCTVVVEDVISLHKVGQVNECICLFGTAFHPVHYYYLLSRCKPVVLWLDYDQKSNVKRQAMQLSSIIDNQVHIVSTEKDPKELTFEEIKQCLSTLPLQ